jgi:4-hydroxy-tetrahydrodipicolinate synthase
MILGGTFPVLCTPFRSDGSIATDDFERLVEFVVECGADGCVFPGVASEVETLTPAERATMVARLGALLRGRIPFIVGATDGTAEETRARIAEGAQAGAIAAMVMAPARFGMDTTAHSAYFAAVGDPEILPLMLQNQPSPVGAGLRPEAVAEIARAVPSIAYVKEETLPCGQNLSRILRAARDAIDGVFGGAGGRYITDELARGALGTMPAAELCDLHVRLVRAWRQGNVTEARQLFRLTLPLLNFQAVFRMHMTKATLVRRGVLRHDHVRGKGPVMDAGDRAELAALLDQVAPELALFPLGKRLESL